MNTGNSFTRKRYWLHVVVSYVITMIVVLIASKFIGGQNATYLYGLVLIYWIIIEVMRFHDANKSGLFALLNLIPGLGTFVALIVAGVMPSDYVNNKWYRGN